MLTPSPTVGPRPWRLVGLRNRVPRACARGGAHRVLKHQEDRSADGDLDADTPPSRSAPVRAGVACADRDSKHLGRSNLEFVQNKAPKVVQNAEFLLRMAEVLIFNAATLCFFDPVNYSTFKRFDGARYSDYLGDLVAAALGRSPSVTLQVESDPRE